MLYARECILGEKKKKELSLQMHLEEAWENSALLNTKASVKSNRH